MRPNTDIHSNNHNRSIYILYYYNTDIANSADKTIITVIPLTQHLSPPSSYYIKKEHILYKGERLARFYLFHL